MSEHLLLLSAQARFCALADRQAGFRASCEYFRMHRIDPQICADFAGIGAVVPIVDCGNCRFDFHDRHQDAFPAFVCEAIGADGETTNDLVAWPVDRPAHVLTMFGRCGLLGLWEAMGAAGTVFDYPLQIHRTPLDWLKAECRGAAIVGKRIAARQLLDLPGKILASDIPHGHELKAMTRAATPRIRIVVPDQIARAA
jgi:hypothetical protein